MIELARFVFADQKVFMLLKKLLVVHNSLIGQKWQLFVNFRLNKNKPNSPKSLTSLMMAIASVLADLS